MLDVVHLRGVDLGITQSSIMSCLKKTGKFGRNIESRLGLIAKLECWLASLLCSMPRPTRRATHSHHPLRGCAIGIGVLNQAPVFVTLQPAHSRAFSP